MRNDWREFPSHEQIGQSDCGRVISAFANELAAVFFRRFAKEM
ncbi:hypothetical protein [Paenibacillus alkalitolerans]|nr:hypothetical protein [Paenibacillus alkalitolerans]